LAIVAIHDELRCRRSQSNPRHQRNDHSALLQRQPNPRGKTEYHDNCRVYLRRGLIRKDSEYPLFDGEGTERTVTNGSQTVIGTFNLDGFGYQVGRNDMARLHRQPSNSGDATDLAESTMAITHAREPTPLQNLYVYDDHLYDFAARSYGHCEDWFGAPSDAEWPCHILQSGRNSCRRSWILREYLITVMKSYTSADQSRATIAYQIYHRVTRLRRGLRQQPWLDEALAFSVSQRVLRVKGLGDYAEFRMDHYCGRRQTSDFAKLAKVSKWIYLVGENSWFYNGAATWISSLEQLLEWDVICRLVHCKTWDEWFQYVPAEKQKQTHDLLNLVIG